MSEKPRPVEDILNALAEMCSEALNNKEAFNEDRVDALVKSLVTNGWDRHSQNEKPLKTQIEDRVRGMQSEEAVHHPEQVQALAGQIEKAYQEASRFETSTPDSEKPLNKRKGQQARSPSTSLEN